MDGGRKDRVNLVVILPLALLRGGLWNAKRMQLGGMQIIVLVGNLQTRQLASLGTSTDCMVVPYWYQEPLPLPGTINRSTNTLTNASRKDFINIQILNSKFLLLL